VNNNTPAKLTQSDRVAGGSVVFYSTYQQFIFWTKRLFPVIPIRKSNLPIDAISQSDLVSRDDYSLRLMDSSVTH
jgi:hypothetical protein